MPDHYIEEWPPYTPNDLERREGVLTAARLAANAAITAPKGGGIPIAEAHIVYGEKEMTQIAKKMVELADVNPSNEMWRTIFKTEAEMVRMSDVILFLGCHTALNPFDITCDYCSGPGKGCKWLYEHVAAKEEYQTMMANLALEQALKALRENRISAFFDLFDEASTVQPELRSLAPKVRALGSSVVSEIVRAFNRHPLAQLAAATNPSMGPSLLLSTVIAFASVNDQSAVPLTASHVGMLIDTVIQAVLQSQKKQ